MRVAVGVGRVSWLDADTVVVLVTPVSSLSTWPPAPTVWPLPTGQASTVLLVEPQLPTVWPVVTSVTAVNPIVLVAAAGKVVVIWLRPGSDVAPAVVALVNLITYSVRAPAAVDGAVLSTDNPETAAG